MHGTKSALPDFAKAAYIGKYFAKPHAYCACCFYHTSYPIHAILPDVLSQFTILALSLCLVVSKCTTERMILQKFDAIK